MNKYKKITPEGFFDLLYPESYHKRLVEKEVLEVFRNFGYFEVKMPTVEYYQVFENQSQDGSINSFKMFDNKGRITVLRPDITLSIARLVSTKLKNKPLPLKISYADSVFRLNEAYGKSREVFQAGIELIGGEGEKADAEVISVAIEALREIGIKNFQIDIGQVDFINKIVESIELEDSEVKEIRSLIDKKDLIGIEEFLENNCVEGYLKEILLNLYSYYGDIDAIDEIKKIAGDEEFIKPLKHLEKVYKILEERGYKEYISIDIGLVSTTNYYTGIIMKGFTYGTGYPIVSGGRYDQLLEKYGDKQTAVGFCINLNDALASLDRQKIDFMIPKTKILIGGSQDGLSYKMASFCRRNNYIVEEELMNLDVVGFKKYIEKKEIPIGVFIENENKGCVFFREYGKYKERAMSFIEINKWMEEGTWTI